MPYLRIEFRTGPPEISLDLLVDRILQQIPDAKITADDWYSNRRKETERTIEGLRRQGHSIRYGDEILASVDRAAEDSGPTKGISVQSGGRGLSGRISRDFMLLHSDVPIDQATADQLSAILWSLGVVKSVTSDTYVARKAQNDE